MKKQDHYKNVGIVILVLVVLAYFLKAKFNLDHNYLLVGVLVFGALLYSFEGLAKKFSELWMRFGELLGAFNAKIILSIFFFLILIPVAFLQGVFTRKRNTKLNSTWQKVGDQKLDFTKPW